MVIINQRVFDTESQQPVEVIDLSKGVYDVTCDVSKAFKNRQGETVNSMIEMAAIDPTVIQEGKDILYKSVNAPGFDILASRARQNMILSGQIPEDELTDEEREFLEAQPPPPPDPVTEALERQADNDDDKITLEGMKHELNEQKFEFEKSQSSMTEAFENIKIMAQALKDQATAYKSLADSKGIEGVELPGIDRILVGQAATVAETQAEQP